MAVVPYVPFDSLFLKIIRNNNDKVGNLFSYFYFLISKMLLFEPICWIMWFIVNAVSCACRLKKIAICVVMMPKEDVSVVASKRYEIRFYHWFLYSVITSCKRI